MRSLFDGGDAPTVEIRTDDWGVSHLYGADRYDLAYAMGYVQARDRLFELDVLRHIAYGDSAPLLGSGQLDSDIQVRRDLHGPAEIRAQYESASAIARETLDGFAAGVNRGMAGRFPDLPAEFATLGHLPEPWSPADSVAIMNYQTGYFGVFGGRELETAALFAQLVSSLGSREAAYDALGDLAWVSLPDAHYTTIPADETAVDGGESALSFADVPDHQLDLAMVAADAEPWGLESDRTFPPAITRGLRRATGLLAGFKWGSNALVVGGEHTATDSPMMFGGPQMGHFAPAVIYEVGLHGAGFDVRGVVPVGTPGVVIGRTPTFAWSVTSGRDDMIDTIGVPLHPDDRHRYRWRGEYREMETETVVHRSSLLGGLVNGTPRVRRVEQEVARIVVDGEDLPVVAWNPDARIAFAQRSTVRGEVLDGAFRWGDIGRQDDLAGVKRQLREFPFAFNFHYAGTDNIAFLHTARIPERNPDLDPRLPAPADEHYWAGTRDGLGIGATVTDPDQGYLLNWNNAPVAGYRSGEGPRIWGTINRAELLDRAFHHQLDAADGELDLAGVAAILEYAATHDVVARYTAPLMARVARDEGLDAMADALVDWGETDYSWRHTDGRYDDPGHAIWEETRQELQTLVLEPVLGELTPDLSLEPPRDIGPDEDETPHAGDHGRTDREILLVNALHGRTTHEWVADPDAAVATALHRARATLRERFDSADPADWRLPIHTTKFRPLGAGEPHDIPMVNRGTWNQVVAPSEDAAMGVLPPGNSAHVGLTDLPALLRGERPERLADQLPLYTAFEYKPMPVGESARAGTAHERTLRVRRSRLVRPILDGLRR